MTRILAMTVIALLGSTALAHAQSGNASSVKCGPEAWSTDTMTYSSNPCPDAPAAARQQAAAPMTDLQYCMALIGEYDRFVNKGGKSGGMQSNDIAANVAAAKCRAGDASDMPSLEQALKNARIDLPPRN
jgi:hypothetical protein